MTSKVPNKVGHSPSRRAETFGQLPPHTGTAEGSKSITLSCRSEGGSRSAYKLRWRILTYGGPTITKVNQKTAANPREVRCNISLRSARAGSKSRKRPDRPAVAKCDIVVYSSLLGKITAGVGKEVNHALKLGKAVYEIQSAGLVQRQRRVKHLTRLRSIQLYRKWWRVRGGN